MIAQETGEGSETERFKKLLAWFVKQLKTNNGILPGEVVSGCGYRGDKIVLLYSDWNTYNGFVLNCTVQSGFNKANKSNYIHLNESQLNIVPYFEKINDKFDVAALQIELKTGDERFPKSDKFSVADLGLLDDAPPNATLVAFFNAYKREIELYQKNNSRPHLTDGGNTQKAEKNDFAKNTILYGPPGTGKTYNMVLYAVAIAEKRTVADGQAEADDDLDAVLARFNKLKEKRRIAFTTFHQSYGYEEFIEGIRPKLDNSGDGRLRYEISSGVFKKFCETAQEEYLKQQGAIDNFSEAYALLKEKVEVGDSLNIPFMEKNGTFPIELQVNGDGFHKVDSRQYYSKEQLYNVYRGKPGVPKGGLDSYRNAIIKYMKERCDLMAYEPAPENAPTLTNTDNFVFIIDEINRGNISKIFGELITLIEDKKRLGEQEGMTAVLPYSGSEFGVPGNVYILGTMNTADRSIALLDTALRRRFDFEEMPSEPSCLRGVTVAEIDIEKLLTTLNARITALLDREHAIGHSYFLPLKKSAAPTLAMLAEIMRKQIVPLLQEYFYDDYEKIRLVLGDNQKEDAQFFVKKGNVQAQDLFGENYDGDVAECYEFNSDAFENKDAYAKLQ